MGDQGVGRSVLNGEAMRTASLMACSNASENLIGHSWAICVTLGATKGQVGLLAALPALLATSCRPAAKID